MTPRVPIHFPINYISPLKTTVQMPKGSRAKRGFLRQARKDRQTKYDILDAVFYNLPCSKIPSGCRAKRGSREYFSNFVSVTKRILATFSVTFYFLKNGDIQQQGCHRQNSSSTQYRAQSSHKNISSTQKELAMLILYIKKQSDFQKIGYTIIDEKQFCYHKISPMVQN